MKKKMTLAAFVFPKLQTPKTWLDKGLKSPVSEDASRSNMRHMPRHCWHLHHRILVIFMGHLQGNWVAKSLSYWLAKSWDCLLSHWLPMKSILFFIEKIERYQFRSNYFRTKKTFSQFFAACSKSRLNFKHFQKKRWPSKILYFRSYGVRKRSQINV